MDSRSINNLISNQEMLSIDLNNTREVKYILNNLQEYRVAHKMDLESNEVFGSMENLLLKSVNADREELIFDWS